MWTPQSEEYIMAVLEYLLVMGVALSLATATSEGHEAVQHITGSLPWDQPVHYMVDHNGY